MVNSWRKGFVHDSPILDEAYRVAGVIGPPRSDNPAKEDRSRKKSTIE
jgi:hypothetical protein